MCVALVFSSPAPPHGSTPIATPNDNTRPAGTLRNGVLALELVAMDARWHAEASVAPGTPVLGLAERGKRPTIPGPLVRAPAGTLVRLALHNTLTKPITFYMPTSPTTDDSVIVAAGATGNLETRLATPGNYVYRATDGTRSSRQLRMAGVMAGAVVVDSAGSSRPRDRVMMILMTPDSANVAGHEAHPALSTLDGRTDFTINGRSWPHTERLSATVGDTLHWRIINGSFDVHPMHLHGFYYTVNQLSGLVVARDGQGAPNRLVVTERMSEFSAMSMTWVPERPGNWLLHCHFSLHLLPPDASSEAGIPASAHANHAMTGMVGLVMGITVAPRGKQATVAVATPARHLRVVAVRDSAGPGNSLRFVIDEVGQRRSAVRGFSPTLYLTRNVPVAITVVNRLPEHTAIHWHGMELESYYDGVAGLSGSGKHIAPTIAPGDSFEVRFTPPRAGTFMYHSHVDDVRQQRAGLVGAMIVRDGPATPMPDDYEIFLKGAVNNDPARSPLEINGRETPDTLVLRAGHPARFRLMSLAIVNPNAAVSLTARPDSAFRSVRDTMLVRWTPVAKDGADLPAAARTPQSARQIISMGETYDFEFTPSRAGQVLRIEVRGISGVLFSRIPIRVE